jgi:hypothetical protein
MDSVRGWFSEKREQSGDALNLIRGTESQYCPSLTWTQRLYGFCICMLAVVALAALISCWVLQVWGWESSAACSAPSSSLPSHLRPSRSCTHSVGRMHCGSSAVCSLDEELPQAIFAPSARRAFWLALSGRFRACASRYCHASLLLRFHFTHFSNQVRLLCTLAVFKLSVAFTRLPVLLPPHSISHLWA